MLALLLSCAEPAPPTPPAAAPTEFESGVDVNPAEALPVDQVVAEAEARSGQTLTIKGTVRQVCQKKGCWHTIATADPAVDVMVKDKEYAIFLPFDAAGRSVVVKGTFSIDTIPLDEARHYAEDAGKDPSSITEPQKAFRMDADGVRLL